MDDDFSAEPSASGILHCLSLLAQEAAALNLPGTFSAIEAALATAARESGMQGAWDNMQHTQAEPVAERHLLH